VTDKQRTFMGRRIVKETVAFGVGGQLVREDGFPELPPHAIVEFRAKADFDNVKHKFLDRGVEEILILTIDTKSFEVLGIEEQPEQEELPMGDEVAAKREASEKAST